METILKILQGIRPDIDFKNATRLFDDHVLDSFDIIQVVNQLNEAYDIEIDVGDLVAENFNSVEGMLELVERMTDD